MIWAIIIEVVLYVVIAALVLIGWYAMPMLVVRLALVLAYLVFLRWGWKRGND